MYRQALQGQKLHNDASEHEIHVAAYTRRLMESQMEKDIETQADADKGLQGWCAGAQNTRIGSRIPRFRLNVDL